MRQHFDVQVQVARAALAHARPTMCSQANVLARTDAFGDDKFNRAVFQAAQAITALRLHPQLQRTRCTFVRVFNLNLDLGVLVLAVHVKRLMAALVASTLTPTHAAKQSIEKCAVVLAVTVFKTL